MDTRLVHHRRVGSEGWVQLVLSSAKMMDHAGDSQSQIGEMSRSTTFQSKPHVKMLRLQNAWIITATTETSHIPMDKTLALNAPSEVVPTLGQRPLSNQIFISHIQQDPLGSQTLGAWPPNSITLYPHSGASASGEQVIIFCRL